MRTFLVAMVDAAEGRRERVGDAAACLDLSDINELVRESEGRRLASRLKVIIDRIIFVDYDLIPDDPEGRAFTLPDPEGEIDIVIARTASGEWLFTQATVSSIDDFIRIVDRRDVVEGVTEVPLTLSPDLWLRSMMPRRLRQRGFVLEHWQWLTLILIVTLGLTADRIISRLLFGLIAYRMQRLHAAVDANLTRQAIRPFGILVMGLVWWFLLRFLGLPAAILPLLVVAVKFITAASGVWGAYRMVDVASAVLEARASRTETRFDDLLVPLFRKSLKIFIAAFGLIFVADTLNLPITSMLAGLSLGGIAFALAAQDTVANLFGSLTVILDRPFQVGDWVVIGEVEGTVEEVGIRTTRVRTFYNSLITVPNSNLIRANVDNLGARTYRRWKTTVGIAYETPPEKIEAFCEGIRELVRRHPYTRKDYFHVYLNGFGPASLDILLYIFHETPDWSTELRERHRLAVDILRLAARLGVEFAYPTQKLYLTRGTAKQVSGEPTSQSDEVEQARALGRSEANSIVERILGSDGTVPPPVTISVDEIENRGEEGDAD